MRRVPAYWGVWWLGQELGRQMDTVSFLEVDICHDRARALFFFSTVLAFQMAMSFVLVGLLSCLDALYFARLLPASVARYRMVGHRPPAPHTLGRMAAVVARNQILSGLTILAFVRWAGPYLPGPPAFRDRDLEGSAPPTWLMSLAYAGLFEIVFYAGHRLLHAYSCLGHALHHQTHTDSAVTFGYMGLVDYTLETTLPALAPLYVVGVHVPAYMGFLAVGLFNAILVHSGWDFPYLASPRRHSIHHTRPTKNLGNGPLDLVFGTAAS